MFYFFYYLPLGFDVRARRWGWATWSLVAASTLGFLLWHARPEWGWSHYQDLVYVPASPRPAALLLNAYAHAGWLHLVMNMGALLVFGPLLEERLGVWRYLLLYHVSNLGANLVQGALVLLFLPGLAGYGILGASGAIAGLMGAFLVRLHFARLRVGYWAFMPFQAYTRAGTTTLSVIPALALWFLLQLGIVMIQGLGGGAQVAAGSHLGGLATGIALALLIGLRSAGVAEQHLHRGQSYLQQAQWYAAQGEFVEYVRRRPRDIEGHLGLARTYRLTGRHTLADDHYRRSCEMLARSGRMGRVEEVPREAERGATGFVLGPTLQLQLAQMLDRTLRPEAAERIYLDYVRAYSQSTGAPLALYRAAHLARRRHDPEQSRDLLGCLLTEHPDSPEADLVRTEPHLRLSVA
jgi:membrane associated rhomboid family serine protease